MIPLDREQDLVVFTDEAGDEKTMEVLDYFFYEGQEYAVLTEYIDEEACNDEEHEHCDACGRELEEMDAYIMRVEPVEDDQEEFVPVEEELMDRLIEFVQNELYADEDEFDEEEEETEEE